MNITSVMDIIVQLDRIKIMGSRMAEVARKNLLSDIRVAINNGALVTNPSIRYNQARCKALLAIVKNKTYRKVPSPRNDRRIDNIEKWNNLSNKMNKNAMIYGSRGKR